MKDKLSIVLPLKGREEYSKRWFQYHSNIRLPWKIYIGDGDINSGLLSQVESYTNNGLLDMVYVSPKEFQSDNAMDHILLFKRLLHLLKAVETPYVMFTHNDDFILPSGVIKSIVFLDNNHDYVSCGGAFLGLYCINKDFSLSRNAFSDDWTGLDFIYPQLIINHDSAFDRLKYLLNNYTPTWFSIHRTEVLTNCFQAIVNLKITDALIVELFQALFVSAYGKTSQDYSRASYLRQLGNSMVFDSMPDLIDRTLRGTQVDDMQKMCSYISRIISEIDMSDYKDVKAAMTDLVIERERQEILTNYAFDLHQEFHRKLKALVYTLRSKLPSIHRILQKQEMQKILDVISNHNVTDLNANKTLEKELNTILMSFSPRG